MAYIVSTLQTATQATGTTYAVNFPDDVQANDTLVVLLSQDGSTESLNVGTSGFTALGTQTEAAGAGASSRAFFKIAAGGETSASFACASDDIIGTAILIRDAHATEPFGASPTNDTDYKQFEWNAVTSAASNLAGDLTSAVDECLLLYMWTNDGANRFMRVKLADCLEVDKYSSGFINHIIGYRQQQTAAVAPTATMYCDASEGGSGYILAIRNKTGGVLQPDMRVTGTEVKFYGSWESAHDAITWQTADTFAAKIPPTTGKTVSAGATTKAYSTTWASSTWGVCTQITSAELLTDTIVGSTHTITSTNMVGKLFAITFAGSAGPTSATYGSDGLLIGFSDGTNWVVYQVASKSKGWGGSVPFCAVIALNNATEYANSDGDAVNSVNWSAVTRVAYLWNRDGSSATATGVQIKSAILFDSFAVTGGGANRPVTAKDITTYLNSWGYHELAKTQASAQVLVKFSTQLGDDTNTTYFDGSAQSIEFPQEWSATSVNNWQMDWNVNSGQVALGVYAKSTDTIKLSAGAATSANN